MTLKLIKTDKPKKKSYRASTKHDKEPIYCPVCNGNMFIEIHSTPMRRGMRWLKRSGQKVLICAMCFKSGKVVEVATD